MRVAVALFVAAVWLTASAPASASTWCGAGEAAGDRPDALTGAQIRLVYAYPSDSVDGFAGTADAIVDDAISVDAWWRREDPARTPRFDLADFPGCAGLAALDIGVVRLSSSAARLAPAADRYRAITRDVPAPGEWKKTVVYYDGPIEEPTLCGEGTGLPTSGVLSVAVVYLRSTCTRSQALRAAVTAHELTHALGAPSGRQPHPCGNDRGHVCDSDHDLMYPALVVESLDELTLDVGHDDYYRNGGRGAFDVSTSAWLRHLDAPQQTLSVSVSSGGVVRSDQPGLVCSATCTSAWDAGSTLVLSARPAPGRRFVGWEGPCSGVACHVTLDESVAVRAVFGAALVRLTVSVTGAGRVLMPGPACAHTCSTGLTPRARVTLTARPARGARFAGWAGACHGRAPRCTVEAVRATAVGARFVR